MRTDAQLENDVIEELRWEPTVTMADINVAVSQGIVTPSGSIGSWDERAKAGSAAWNAPTVTEVRNDLAVAF